MMSLLRLFALSLLATGTLMAGATEDWAQITALDAGPKKKPATREEAVLLARNHLTLQRKAIEAFLLKYPQDSRAFEAKMRQASILAAEGKMEGNQRKVDEALESFANLEKNSTATPEQRADAGFRRVSLVMQNQSGDAASRREAVVAAARNYTAKYPGDRRGPRLLVEAATLCDGQPNEKRNLLEEALRLTNEPALKARIADDFKRLDLLGRRVEMKLPTVNMGEFDLASLRGNVTVVIFWAAESPHSLLWLQGFRTAWEKMPKNQLRIVSISLDSNRGLLNDKLKDLPATWPTYFDSRGWDGPVPRSFGINAIPTVWIIDKQGVLRAINARDDYQTWIDRLLAE